MTTMALLVPERITNRLVCPELRPDYLSHVQSTRTTTSKKGKASREANVLKSATKSGKKKSSTTDDSGERGKAGSAESARNYWIEYYDVEEERWICEFPSTPAYAKLWRSQLGFP